MFSLWSREQCANEELSVKADVNHTQNGNDFGTQSGTDGTITQK